MPHQPQPSLLRSIAFAFVLALFLTGTSGVGAQAPVVRVLCSNVIKEAVERLRPVFERESGQRLAITYGASAELRRTAEGSQPFDLALLTTGIVDDLSANGVILTGSRTAIAQANLAVAVRADAPKSDVSTAAGMRQRLLGARSITYSRDGGGVPAIERMIAALGIATQVQSKIVKQSAAGRAAEAVALGEEELAFAPLTEIVAVQGVQVLGLFPDEFQSPLAIASGVGAHAANPSGARALAQFLLTAEAMRVIEATGMMRTRP